MVTKSEQQFFVPLDIDKKLAEESTILRLANNFPSRFYEKLLALFPDYGQRSQRSKGITELDTQCKELIRLQG